MKTKELKTLKDLEPLIYDKKEERFYIKIEQLKAEAVKWIKMARVDPRRAIMKICGTINFMGINEQNIKTFYGVELELVVKIIEEYIMWQNNLTEEDLDKDKK